MMGKLKCEWMFVDNEVWVMMWMICVFFCKFNFVVVGICGKKVGFVIVDLIFFCKCIVQDVKKILMFVVVNVENNYDLDIDNLVVVEVYVGKVFVIKCFQVCVCGWVGWIEKLFLNLIIVVCEVEESV